jgi:hypothetical protein
MFAVCLYPFNILCRSSPVFGGTGREAIQALQRVTRSFMLLLYPLLQAFFRVSGPTFLGRSVCPPRPRLSMTLRLLRRGRSGARSLSSPSPRGFPLPKISGGVYSRRFALVVNPFINPLNGGAAAPARGRGPQGNQKRNPP